MKVATFDNNEVHVQVILDTGTKLNWISQRFLKDKIGVKYKKLNDDENKREFTDFNGNKFNGIGKVELMVQSVDFAHFPCRTISFLVAKEGKFNVLLGSRTIKMENLLCKPAESQREGAFPAVQTDPKKGRKYLRNLGFRFLLIGTKRNEL
jgi:hypothetical protein